MCLYVYARYNAWLLQANAVLFSYDKLRPPTAKVHYSGLGPSLKSAASMNASDWEQKRAELLEEERLLNDVLQRKSELRFLQLVCT